MTYYKLTDSNHQTRGGCQWGTGVTHETDGRGKLFGPGWIHVYTDPLLAVMIAPMHKVSHYTVMWECKCCGHIKTNDLMATGFTRVTTLRIVPSPVVTTAQRVRFGILAALMVYDDKYFVEWAYRWLNGLDRSEFKALAQLANVRLNYQLNGEPNWEAVCAVSYATLAASNFTSSRDHADYYSAAAGASAAKDMLLRCETLDLVSFARKAGATKPVGLS